MLEEIEVSTGLFTPNGDRVNDLLHIRFDLVNLSAAVPVSLKVFDLTGTRRAELPLAQRASGPHTVSWDGMDGNGKLLHPGIYVLRLEVYLEVIEEGRKRGINACKFHSYKGGKADIPIFREVRDVVGPDFLLLNDPVCSYTLREAIEVGHVMEELDFVWLEEPMHEQKENQYRELCRELDMPVMGNETLMGDIGLSTQRLISGATDLLRANARFGTTQVLKMAHFAEMHGTTVELNHEGGLFGQIHAHLGCCLDNTSFFEAGLNDFTDKGAVWGMLNTPVIEDGHITPSPDPGWGVQWDRDRFDHMTVEVHGGGGSVS